MRTITTTFADDGTITLTDPGCNVHLSVRPADGGGILQLLLQPLDAVTPLNNGALGVAVALVDMARALAPMGSNGNAQPAADSTVEAAPTVDDATPQAVWPRGSRPNVDEFADHYRRLDGDVHALASFFGVGLDRIYGWTRNARSAKPPRLPKARAAAR